MSGSGEAASCSQKSNSDDQDEEVEKSQVVSLKEIIEEQKEEEETVAAVLGDSDEANCSYDLGYVKRQALYACKTCQTEKEEGEPILHGICLACSYECHADHELEELYTKRNFRCDCGNSRFANGNPCKLRPNKDPTNPLNKYNHNFLGLYCVCNKPYPLGQSAPDSTITTSTTTKNTTEEPATTTTSTAADSSNDEMVQCIICEDWFHLGHLKGVDTSSQNTDPNQDDYEDLVCHACMLKSTDFLWYYQGTNPLESLDVNVVDSSSSNTPSSEGLSSSSHHSECILAALKSKNEPTVRAKYIDSRPDRCACFLQPKWRRALCRCEACVRMYKERECEYLLDEEADSIVSYEERGKARMADAEKKAITDKLGQLNRVGQIEYLHQYNDFQEELGQFLEQFAREDKVVKREHVLEFFEALNDKRKRRKLENSQMGNGTYYCK